MHAATRSKLPPLPKRQEPAAPAPAPEPQGAPDHARALMAAGAAMFLIALGGALADQEPFHTAFFCFAWWSYILFVDGWVHRRRGESLLLSHPGRFAFFTVFSVGLWFLFEALNLRLGNWTYRGLPTETTLRWAGYLLGFATVVPALMETADLVDTAGILGDGHIRPIGWKKPVNKYAAAAGAAALALTLLWPGLFFPLVWVAFALLVDPVNERLGAPSLITDWREGSAKRLRVLLLSGLFCGVLWEAWNMPAGARWEYNLPGLSGVKIFEMPLPGYLGFPFFAVEVFALSSLALALWEKASRPLKAVLLAAWAGFAYLMCGLVDKMTAVLPL
jgi:hypothetical protein